MPSTVVSQNPQSKANKGPADWFTGTVYLDPLSTIAPDSGAAGANVTFTPCARTNWHTHVKGQVLIVLSGSGWICDQGQEPRRIKAGDVIWASPGTTHWHGASKDSLLTHTALGLGACTWLDPVTDEDYAKAGGA
jgi:quercetin dioxygenase-like cupin family protein